MYFEASTRSSPHFLWSLYWRVLRIDHAYETNLPYSIRIFSAVLAYELVHALFIFLA